MGKQDSGVKVQVVANTQSKPWLERQMRIYGRTYEFISKRWPKWKAKVKSVIERPTFSIVKMTVQKARNSITITKSHPIGDGLTQLVTMFEFHTVQGVMFITEQQSIAWIVE